MAYFRFPQFADSVIINGRQFRANANKLVLLTDAADIAEAAKLGGVLDAGGGGSPEWIIGADGVATGLAGPDGTAAAGAAVVAAATLADIVATPATKTAYQTALGITGASTSIVSVKDYGAVGDGSTNDLSAIQAAFTAALAAGKKILFPQGTYYCGTFTTNGETKFNLAGQGDGITIYTQGLVTLKGQTTANVIGRFFALGNNNKFYCDPIAFQDTGYDYATNFKGATGFHLYTYNADWGNVHFAGITATDMLSAMTVNGGGVGATYRIRGIQVDMMSCDNVYYGINCQEQGDGLNVDLMVCRYMHRCYYVYGVTGHRVNIYNRQAIGSGSGIVNVSRDVGGLNSKDIHVRYTCRDSSEANTTHVLLSHKDLSGGSISNVHIDLDIAGSVAYTPIAFRNELSGSFDAGASTNRMYDITVTGTCDSNSSGVAVTASYADRGNLWLNAGENMSMTAADMAKFTVKRPVTLDANGDMLHGNLVIGNGKASIDTNVALGKTALLSNTSGANNLAVGTQALYSNTSGQENVSVGTNANWHNTTASNTVAIGTNALTANVSGAANVAVGDNALATMTAQGNNVAIGFYAGKYETGGQKLFIDSINRTNEATGRTNSLIYGVFDSTVANQRLNVNATLKTLTSTVAALPSASTAGVGMRAFVTDATAPTWGATVAGGGAVATPVFSDGTNWKVG